MRIEIGPKYDNVSGNFVTKVVVDGEHGRFADIFTDRDRGIRWAEDVMVAHYGHTTTTARQELPA